MTRQLTIGEEQDSSKILMRYAPWDVVLIQTSGFPTPVGHKFLRYWDRRGNSRGIEFYPRVTQRFMRTRGLPQSEYNEHDWKEHIKFRYNQAIKNMAIKAGECSLEDFMKPDRRLIGAEPRPWRSVLFCDDSVWSGVTLETCVEDFIQMGYGRDRIWLDGYDKVMQIKVVETRAA